VSDGRTTAGWWTWLVTGLILIATIILLLAWGRPLYEFIADQERIRDWVEGFGLWGPVAITALEIAQILLAPIPGQAIEAVSGYLYGPWLGSLYAMIGIGTGSLVSFLLARRFGRPWVVRLFGAQTVARMDDLARRGGAPFFFLIWLLPFVPDDVACLVAGLTPMRIPRFLFLMILGRFPGIFVSTWVGASVAQIEPIWLIGLIVLATVAALVLWRWGERLRDGVFQFLQRLLDGSRH
jgi:uncharacterized membrane protein YdjX (TVP38/TMEM64 family)